MPRFRKEASDEEVARRLRFSRDSAARARSTYEGKALSPLFEITFLNPCDWHSRCRSVVQAPDEEAAVAAFLRSEPTITRREIVAARDVSLPAWERNCAFAQGGRQSVAPYPENPELADSPSTT